MFTVMQEIWFCFIFSGHTSEPSINSQALANLSQSKLQPRENETWPAVDLINKYDAGQTAWKYK